MSDNFAIRLKNVVKEYKVYASPRARLLYSLIKLKRYQPRVFKATDNVSFDIKKGEIVGIIGRNGAGKSTILKMITGVSFPTSGKLEINGRISSLLELGAGFNTELTGMENIYFQGNLLGISNKEMAKRVPDILAFAEIGDFIHQPVKNYSSGMFARLAFATAINVDPDILIVDEVLSVGDIAFQFKCIEKMKEFAQRGVTILFVTHSMMSLYRFCHRAIWIDHGKQIMDGTVEDVVPKYEDSIKRTEARGEDVDNPIENSDDEVAYIKLNEVALIQNGNKTKQINKKENFTISVTYDLLKSLKEKPYFAISLVKEGLNYDMFGFYPDKAMYALSAEKGRYKIEIEFHHPQLNITDYSLYFAILENNGMTHLFSDKIVSFKVVGQQETLGLIDIPHEIKKTKIS